MTLEALLKANKLKQELDDLTAEIVKDEEAFDEVINQWSEQNQENRFYIFDECSKKGIHVMFHGSAYLFIKDLMKSKIDGMKEKAQKILNEITAL